MISLLNQIRGILSVIYLTINTLIWVSLLFVVTFMKLAIPLKSWRKICGRAAIFMAERWIFFNNTGLNYTRKMRLNLKGVEQLDRKAWYLVISNHQSWVDIPILQQVLYQKIPFLKFFLKKELIWVPLLGQAWWALDFPFMKRYSNEFIKKNPHLKGKDLEITKKACEKFKDNPVSIMNFTEGTRFSIEKRMRQKSPYQHLLKPKSGGIGFVLTVMGQQLSYILDVTISYPFGTPNIWDFLCGQVKQIDIVVKKIPVSEAFLGDYINDKRFRVWLQRWLNDLWLEKDHYLEQVFSNATES